MRKEVDMDSKEKKNGILSTALFMMIILGGLIFLISRCGNELAFSLYEMMIGEASASDTIKRCEESINSSFSGEEFSLDAFSFVQNVLGKRETRNFEVLKSKEGMLYLQDNGWPSDEDTLTTVVEEYKLIYEKTCEYGGDFLFVQVPYKNSGQALELKLYSNDKTESSEDYIVETLVKENIPVLDLRNYENCCEWYNTDHHWTVMAGFNSTVQIINELAQNNNIEFKGSEFYGNVNNYKTVTYENGMLGSIGVKVGPYYAGKDDFSIYTPLFDTKLKICHYVNHINDFEIEGDFWTSFVNEEILEDQTYYNKYGALLNGAYNETIINNECSLNDYTCLLISHSYGRPVAMYLSMEFKELRYLDPQDGRYTDNFLDYIKDYRPDVVVLMYNSTINVGE